MLHNYAKFREDRSICCGDIAIFAIFNMAAAAILEFQKCKILTVFPCRGPICVNLPNFIKIGQTVAEIWRFNCFSKWRLSAILDLSGAYWDYQRRVFGGLYLSG